ncbi:malonate-semialdehyde dehydrogenase (acetylating)/methylmalonate-semialdehyde dehydrogenase [Silvibacterium bohemicum]|uniref:methylmalonate-semialdehyde dehydrogenase (CoA acylating) n=1 Tax=Silvibacterium bohemicum TaxID=1577686 RepID=A0A841K112_9BACT|nr:CoA-acylating methylmalonate-semialdehyde dehydrogenase [Silvibacterium bohemicum]MBB6147272.1 malonate-semialdehyde dehydrogenase (acetylating)/methylmalonate-semialdehyde dehydrogenase [Silvibacterium bohemicum]
MSTSAVSPVTVSNYVNGKWVESSTSDWLDVVNPATHELIARAPSSGAAEVNAAVEAAAAAFPAWRRTPAEDRIQPLFKLKMLLEDHIDELARLISRENGKTFIEAKAELRRAIENVEVACGIPMMMQGSNLEDVARGIDEMMIRQPLGVVAAITPFNFPGMIPFWFLPYAIATGNTIVLKPSERVPLTMARAMELIEQTGLPKGVVNLVNGGKAAVDALLDHPKIRAISFVGSTAIAKYVYARAAANGKRAQCQGGAKNHVIVLPDAEMKMATQIINDSAFGCAGQRCLAVSVAVTIGDAQKSFRDSIVEAAAALKVGNGLEDGVQMGPVITPQSKSRIESLVAAGEKEGAKVVLDGRNPKGLTGNFVKPTILDGVPAASELTDTEIFGPVLSLVHAHDMDEALAFLERSAYGNQASLFTSSGAAARRFRYEAPAGNIGINIGVAAPMAYFPFSGWKGSFFGDLHAQGRDSIEFYTDKKIVVERWASDHSRKF